MPHRLRISIPRHGDVDLRSPNIHAGRIRVQADQCRRFYFLAALSFSRHGSLSIGLTMRDGPNCAKLSTLLNGIDVPHYENAVTTVLSTESGTILLNGLPKDAPLVFRPTCRRAWTAHSIAPGISLRFLTFLTRAARVGYS